MTRSLFSLSLGIFALGIVEFGMIGILADMEADI